MGIPDIHAPGHFFASHLGWGRELGFFHQPSALVIPEVVKHVVVIHGSLTHLDPGVRLQIPVAPLFLGANPEILLDLFDPDDLHGFQMGVQGDAHIDAHADESREAFPIGGVWPHH